MLPGRQELSFFMHFLFKIEATIPISFQINSSFKTQTVIVVFALIKQPTIKAIHVFTSPDHDTISAFSCQMRLIDSEQRSMIS
jgi:hypothetical protein